MLQFSLVALACCAALANGCAQTTNGGGGSVVADTGGTAAADTTGAKTDTVAAGETAGGDSSTVGAEKNIIDLQKASAACPTPNPDFYGASLGVTIRNAIVTSPGRDEGNAKPATLIGLFVQQKSGGQWSGMYVTGKKSDELGQVKVGDVITMTGDVKDFYCFTQIQSKFTTIETLGKELAVALTVTTADLGDIAGLEKTEPYESVLVQLHDVVVGEDALGSDGKAHGDVYIGKDDKDKALRMGSGFYGVYMSDKKDGTFTPKYPKGTKLGTVTGVVEYSFNTFRLVITRDPEGVVKP